MIKLLIGAVAAAVALVAVSTSFAVTAKPSITRFTPSTAKPGATVTITGKDFTGVKTVEFAGLKATFKVMSATKIAAKVPAKAKNGKITIVTTTGTAVSAAMLKV